MAFRTWGRLLLTALGVSVLAGAGQLGVAYGFGIVRLTGAFTGTTVNQWPAQLVWVGWFAANAAVAGAVLTGRLARRDTPAASTGRQLAIGGAAALGATAVAPLCMQPARAAELISVDPVWAVGICAILGAVIGAGAAVAVLFRPELGWNMAAVAGAVWLLALISVLPSLGTAGPLPTVRLGVLEPSWLNDAAAQRLALLLLPVVALLAGAATAGLARWRGQVPLVSGATGVAGPVLVAFAYLTAGPGDAVDRYQTTPYYGALIAILAGALGAAAAALLRWPIIARTADPQAIAPTDILRPLPAGPSLPDAEAARSTGPADDATPSGGDLATTGPGPRAADDTAGVRTVPAHWDWPATTASGQHGTVPADATPPGPAPRPVGRRQHADTTSDAATAGTPSQDTLPTGGQHDRATNPPAPASWLTDPTGEFTAGRQTTPSSRDGDAIGAAVPMPAVPASTAAVGDTGAAGPTPRADADDPTGKTTTATTAGDDRSSDDTTTSDPAIPVPPVAVPPVAVTPRADDAGTPSAGNATTPVADGAGTRVAGNAGTPSADVAGTPVAGNAAATSAGTLSASSAATPSAGNAATPSASSAGTPSAGNAATPSAGSAGDGTADAPAPKPRRTRKPKSTPAEVTPGTTAEDTAAAAGSTGGRTRRPARSGKATDVSGTESAGPVDHAAPGPDQDAPLPDRDAPLPGDTEPAQASQTGGKGLREQTDGTGAESRRDRAAGTDSTVTTAPVGDPAPVVGSATGRAERSAAQGDGGASLFGEASVDGPEADRWTPTAPAWPVTSAWTAAPGTADPEPSASDAPVPAEESTDWTPRFRHRAPLPDLSRASTWDAFNTTRRTAASDRTTSTADQSTGAPGQGSPTAGIPDQDGPTAATLDGGLPTGRAASTTGQANSTTDQRGSTTDQHGSTTDQPGGTTDRAVGRRGRAGEATGTPASAGSVAPPSTGPGIPGQNGASGTAGSGASGTAGSDGPDSDARRAVPTSTDDAEQPSRRGRLGGLFRRNRVRADEEKRSAADAAEPLATQDEEFVDWVAGLGKPIADNEPEQENGRRSLRSTGRHHRD
ncbi:hypothetical protein [Micromonospora sp. MH99]|uniref:hypothetical protein n=1 Tax=Micromonospora sp. MH99 TaxID=1945510 RepID=UPI001F281DBA|nr:hypothetical protein [Micromonospora sp. MH99]